MTAQKYLKRLGGFTLVELLIVIAILAIIALIVIAAINPIEQANRARDTGQKADASQFLSANDRYFAAKSEFVWVTVDNVGGGSATNDDAFGYITIDDATVGLCATSGDCASDPGLLITQQELKPEFGNRRFVDAANVSDRMFIGKADQEQSVYVCYIPMAKSNRAKACEDQKVYTLAGLGVRSQIVCDPAAEPQWVGANLDGTDSYFVCVPE